MLYRISLSLIHRYSIQVPEVISAANPLIYHRFLRLAELELLTQHGEPRCTSRPFFFATVPMSYNLSVFAARRTGVADGDAVWHRSGMQWEIDEE